jgi:hypothetical protein
MPLLAATVAFQAQDEISTGREHRPSLHDHRIYPALPWSRVVFAVSCPLPPARLRLGSCSSARELSFTPVSRPANPRFASLAATRSPEDFPLQVESHAGRPQQKKPANAGFFVVQSLSD